MTKTKRTIEEPIDESELQKRITHLRKLKVSERAIASLQKEKPSLYATEEIDRRLRALEEDLSFSDPVKLINTSPAILALLPEKINEKLDDLRKYIADPVSFAEQFPPILTYSFKENIEQKLKMLDRLIKHYRLPFTLDELARRNSSLLTSKIDKLWVLARIIRKFVADPSEFSHKDMSRLLFANIEDVVGTIWKTRGEKMSLKDFIAEIKQAEKSNLPREEKRAKIGELAPIADSDEDKIIARYYRGYLAK